jgi:hypothetical protein
LLMVDLHLFQRRQDFREDAIAASGTAISEGCHGADTMPLSCQKKELE